MDGARMRLCTGYEFDCLADQHGFVVIYSDGYRRNWNDCRKYATFPAKRQNIDDMSFFRTLIGRASVEYPRRLRLCSGFGSSTTSPSSLARFRFTSARSFPTSSVIFFSISATATHRRQHRQVSELLKRLTCSPPVSVRGDLQERRCLHLRTCPV
jgi:hypothetical protein